MNAVKDFHDTFGLSYNDSPTVALEKKIIELRYNLMKEENEAVSYTHLTLPTKRKE